MNSTKFVEIDSKNVIVGAFKRSEDIESDFILRLHEDRGEQTVAQISFNFGLTSHDQVSRIKGVSIVNTLEEEEESGHDDGHFSFDVENQRVTLGLRPYKIVSLALHF